MLGGNTMDRPWLQHYPAGVPHDAKVDQFDTVVALLNESFNAYRAATAFSCMGKSLTYGQVDKESVALGAYLQAVGLERGDRVAIMMPNVLQYPVCVAGILRAGFVVVNVNPLYTSRELEHQLKDSGAKAIIIIENFAATLQPVLPKIDLKSIIVAKMGDMLGFPKGAIVNTVVRRVKKMVPPYALPGSTTFTDVLKAGRTKNMVTPKIDAEDIAFLQYTGGTTGVSKGATLLHKNIVANVLQNEAWLGPALRKGKPVDQLTIVTALPLYHIFALTVCALMGMRTGSQMILIPNPRDIPGTVKDISKYRLTLFPAVNTLYNALLNNPDFAKLDFSWLKACVGGGMAVQKAVADRWYEVTGCPIVEGYGLSETSPVLSCNRADSADYTGTIGLPLPNTYISIRDDNEQEVALGERGEVCAKGPQVMAGYWLRPDETANVFTSDGYFKTGDIGVMDEKGQVKIVDRKKDMILVSGFNVYPNEVEDVAAGHGGVLECAVVGVPDKNSGEAVMLFVVKKDPKLREDELAKFCSENLTGYKRPKYIVFKSDLPKTNVGKILRRELRDEALKNVR